MSEFTPLREAVDALAHRAPPPDFGELERRATRRGRRRVAALTKPESTNTARSVGPRQARQEPQQPGEQRQESPRAPTQVREKEKCKKKKKKKK